MSDATGVKMTCEKAGLMVVAGGRETIYECARPNGEPYGCYAVADGQLVDVSAEAVALNSSFVCS